MSTQDKMSTDYLWLRDHSQADSWSKSRTHGYNYLYSHVPNKRERLEMTYRSVGKQTDWEMERFRLQKKPIDRGNKKRFVKNLVRFVKHPLGYFYWKTYQRRTASARLQAITISLGMLFMVMKYKAESYRNAKKLNYLTISGKNVEGSGMTHFGWGDEHWAKQQMPLTQALYYDLPGYKIVVNPCRDQNYRKYFEMRKKNGIKPPNLA